MESEDFVESLYTPGLIFLLNTALPVLFMVLDHQYVGIISLSEQNLAKFEYYHNPATNLRLLKARSYLLRIAAIFITVASIYRKANENEVWTHVVRVFTPCFQCWESLLGQSMWNLLLVNAVLSVIFTIGLAS